MSSSPDPHPAAVFGLLAEFENALIATVQAAAAGVHYTDDTACSMGGSAGNCYELAPS